MCKFWLEGTCKKGNACTFVHPQGGGAAAGGGFASGASGGSGGFGAPVGGGGGGFDNKPHGNTQWNKTTLKKQIATDFSMTKTVWPFSSYGVPDEPSLLPGDFSFEEVRLQAYVEAAQGRFQQQVAKEGALAQQVNDSKSKLLKNPYHFVQNQPGAPPGGVSMQGGSPGGGWGGGGGGGVGGAGGGAPAGGGAWGAAPAASAGGGGGGFGW